MYARESALPLSHIYESIGEQTKNFNFLFQCQRQGNGGGEDLSRVSSSNWMSKTYVFCICFFFSWKTLHDRAQASDRNRHVAHCAHTPIYRMLWMNLHAENRKRKIHLTLNAHSIPEISDSEQSPHGNKCHSNIYIYIYCEKECSSYAKLPCQEQLLSY